MTPFLYPDLGSLHTQDGFCSTELPNCEKLSVYLSAVMNYWIHAIYSQQATFLLTVVIVGIRHEINQSCQPDSIYNYQVCQTDKTNIYKILYWGVRS